MTETNVANGFFAKFVAGGLILRLLVVLGAVLFGLIVSFAALWLASVQIDWVAHAIAFALMAIALTVAHFVEGITVDPQIALARLMATTAIRVGLPLVGIVLLDRVVRPGFLASTLLFWLIGFSIGLLTSVLLTVGRLSLETKT